MTTTQFSVKIIYNEEIRRFPYPLNNTSDAKFSDFLQHLRNTYSLDVSNPNAFKLSYVDEEGDKITVSSDLEMMEAFRSVSSGKVLRLTLNIVQQATKPQPKKSTIVLQTTPTREVKCAEVTQKKEEEKSEEEDVPEWVVKSMQEKKEKYGKELEELKLRDLGVSDAELLKELAYFNGNVAKVENEIKTRTERQRKRTAKLEAIAARYPQQVATLTEMGFTHNRRLWLLEKYNGDVAKVVDDLQNNKHNFTPEELANKYSIQLKQLDAMGFTQRRRLWLLQKFDGDVAKVIDRLENKRGSVSELQVKFKDQLEYLEKLGYTCLPVNIRLLRKFDGDVEKVEKRLSARQNDRPFWRRRCGW